MTKWEYCEVSNVGNHVTISYLTEEGNGYDSHEVAARKTNNMAAVLARLGREGWEVVHIHPEYYEDGTCAFTYTAATFNTIAFLKRPLPPSEAP